ncbi:MAG: 4-carboxy-4-hydroxy-2-oxoadipate aldolase/oxaloacetate decarboxylase, partial [Victivallales bacterium]|nr:4-carboxy-4-hydroxy-2-oxoadipate aldolase/oxaloacetate decarboxylase [Victivallales bacterium]
MFHVYHNIPRPDKKLIAAFSDQASATVHEAAGRIGNVDFRIKSLKRGVRVLGPALTVQCHPKDNLMLHKAIEIAQEGDVIIASTGGYYEAGYWGGLMALSAKARKIGGLVIDGCVRDSEEIIEMGFPVFCRGTCIKGTVKANLGLVNHPIVFGGIIVNPGDLVLGDDDGLVVIPSADVEKVLKASQQR